jgi:hypothetical protein
MTLLLAIKKPVGVILWVFYWFTCGGAKPHKGPFYYTTLSLYKKSRKEMASLGENGQEYKCPFFKSARGLCAKGPPKNRLWA